ncbi:hypothetical protein [Helicobacter pylori]|uniref:hypothetical protein n=1 Tax=Helicobacter pylori TaxID=210 RepID=UPI00269B29C9
MKTSTTGGVIGTFGYVDMKKSFRLDSVLGTNKNFNITSDKVSPSLIHAMRTYKIKPTLKMTLSEAINNPNLKAFDELTKKRKIQHNRSFLGCIKSIKAKLEKNHCHIVSASHQVWGAHKVASRFNAKNPFSLDSVLKPINLTLTLD